ncbi:DUF2975 domain-containing protein [Kiloniella sp. b19]|uniref:DUF2975 domain-containing protein n=1 Tax=Kiloniella sp. GXU_MW_B19 TaxID=3141326 RepID=UPI0031CF2D0B
MSISHEEISRTGRQVRMLFWAVVGFGLIGFLGLPAFAGFVIEPNLDNNWMLSSYMSLDLLFYPDEFDRVPSDHALMIYSSALMLTGLMIALVWQIDRLFSHFSKGLIFTDHTVDLFRNIGLVLIALFVGNIIASNIIEYVFVSFELAEIAEELAGEVPREMAEEEGLLEHVIRLDFSFLLSGVFILAVSRVMRLGVALQDDADATI